MQKYTQEQREDALALISNGLSERATAQLLNIPRTTIQDWRYKAEEDSEVVSQDGANILFLDLEVSATLAASFSRFKAFISPDAIVQEPYVLTAAWAKNDGPVEGLGLHQLPTWQEDPSNDILLVERVWELLDEADVVIAHNAGFDTGWMNNRFAYYGITPPSPFKTICTLKALKKYFTLPANSLDASTKYFELDRKRSHEGIGLWLKCMQGDADAVEKMLEYNFGDIPTLRQLYYKVLPFTQNHPNMAMYYEDSQMRCNACGSTNIALEDGKYSYTNLSKFAVHRCGDCGSVRRTRKNVRTKAQLENTNMNIA